MRAIIMMAKPINAVGWCVAGAVTMMRRRIDSTGAKLVAT